MGWQEEEEVPEDEPSVAVPEEEESEEEVVDKFTRVCRTCFQDDIGAPENYQWCALEGGLLFKDAKWEVGQCYNTDCQGDSEPTTKANLIIDDSVDTSSVESESAEEGSGDFPPSVGAKMEMEILDNLEAEKSEEEVVSSEEEVVSSDGEPAGDPIKPCAAHLTQYGATNNCLKSCGLHDFDVRD